VVSYGGGSHNEFYLSEAVNVTQLESRLQSLPFQGGTADAAAAFSIASQVCLSFF
jgi:hypothetical protein